MRRPTAIRTDAPPAASPEAELAGLVTTRANLQARRDALKVEVEQAIAARRALLIEGGGAAAISDAERACREAEGTAFGVDDALAEVERRIAATEERIREQRAASERETSATALERDGAAIDAAAEQVRQAVATLASATTALASAISPRAAPLFAKRDMHGVRNGEPPERIAAFLVGHMIATAMPLIEVAEAGRQERFGWVSRREIEPKDGNVPERPLLTDPMRDLAARVRGGEASPVLSAYHQPEPDFEPGREEIAVYVTSEFSYVRKTGYVAEVVSVTLASLPVPVAEQAIKRGVASRDEPDNWSALLRQAELRSRQHRNIFEYPPLGFNLEEWRAAETKRRRDAWLAEQGREAA
ncbi:hypothetical protein MKK68_19965 [Methylobacterium sp. E-016]|uniref:hypothetical protein n=1 Tax=Methylobacterium sp. E-016 TaxID=2836556 RepID=UPI001FBB1247|nr:hypothetical protein [Methylobacterium sp. E-016]MCJ2077891.1 hypothetical protein [Methylobacterium sp. E-016]